ncbi:MAG: class I SAM-dependent methyltransferase [Gaiellaceae bacterium]
MATAAEHTVSIEETREAWDAIATGYDRYVTPTHEWLGNEALSRAGLKAGMRFLDVASGSGALSIPAARLGAEVLATDISQTMAERLEARAASEGLVGVEARVMDGHALELEDDTYDVAGSQFGVMLFPDLPKGVGELARVTRPGGTVVLVVYGPPTQIDFLTFFMGAMQSVVPGFTGLPMDPPPLPFQVADPEKLRGALVAAGLTDVCIETVVETLEFETGKQMWDWVVNSNPIGAMLVADLDDEQEAAVREALDAMLHERSVGARPAVLTNPVHIGLGSAV